MTDQTNSDHSSEDSESRKVSRRKFLKWASYVPPTILGVMSTSRPAYAASCNPLSCNPDCNPNADCNPDLGCGPDGCPPDVPGCGPDGCPPNNRGGGCGPDG